jgi:hypothetical protein
LKIPWTDPDDVEAMFALFEELARVEVEDVFEVCVLF